MPTHAQHRVILVVDVESFGSRADPEQLWLRRQVYDIVEDAAADCGIRLGEDSKDQGDGAFWLLAADTPKVHLAGRFISRLHDGLLGYAKVSSSLGALRLRVALHAGDVTRDGRGWTGTDLNTVCRLVDLQALRVALAAADRACLVLGVSDDFYRAVIRHDYPEVERTSYRAVPFRAKEVDQRAWIRVPGYDSPPGELEAAGPAPAPEPAPTPTATPAHAPAPPAAGSFNSFQGATFPNHSGPVYGGHHFDHGTAPEES